jgi:biopolymer transport protein ExbD
VGGRHAVSDRAQRRRSRRYKPMAKVHVLPISPMVLTLLIVLMAIAPLLILGG